MGFKLFTKTTTLKVEKQNADFKDYLIEQMTKMVIEQYHSARQRCDVIDFELNPILRIGANSGLNGKLTFYENEDHISITVQLQNAYSAASSILTSIILVAVTFVAFFNSNDTDKWIYLIIFPVGAVVLLLINSAFFHLSSWFRFNNLVIRIKTIGSVK